MDVWASVREETEQHGGLPLEPVWYGVIALAIFVVLLAVTFGFRNAATKH